MELIHELLGYKNIKIIQDSEMFNFSTDSMQLAYFVSCSPKTSKIIDLGCGNAPIPLFLTMKTKAHIIGVDIQKEICDMAIRSVKLNHFEDQIEIINADIKDIYKKVGTNCFDIVTCNPPYFKYLETSNINKNDYLTIARHEVKITLEDIISESKKLLTEKGSLYLVHRVDRFPEIINLLSKYKFEAKRIRFMYPKVNSDEALLVLIDAKNNANPGLKILPPFYMYNENGEYTKEALDMFNYKPKS